MYHDLEMTTFYHDFLTPMNHFSTLMYHNFWTHKYHDLEITTIYHDILTFWHFSTLMYHDFLTPMSMFHDFLTPMHQDFWTLMYQNFSHYFMIFWHPFIMRQYPDA